jgi:ubiquinone/menaquinone biosynthesis C-methylase UbiE
LGKLDNERTRILKEYERRKKEISQDRYSVFNPSALHTRFSREKMAIELLNKNNSFPTHDSKCLEVGCGSLGWLGTLICWGVKEENLYGIDLDKNRVKIAKSVLPTANLAVGDASQMPFKDNFFSLVIASTVFTSVLDNEMKSTIAQETSRILKKGGVFLYYDFAYDNPKNPNVKGVKKKEILKLFPNFKYKIQKITLAPPISRIVAPKSFLFASLLEAIPFLRTHLIGIFIKE